MTCRRFTITQSSPKRKKRINCACLNKNVKRPLVSYPVDAFSFWAKALFKRKRPMPLRDIPAFFHRKRQIPSAGI